MTSTEAEKREAAEALEAFKALGGRAETGQKVKDPEKIALVEAAEQVPEPEPAATPETVTPIPGKQKGKPAPEPTGEGIRVELWGNVSMMVYPEAQGTFPVEFWMADRRVCIDAPKSPPWLSPKLQDRMVAMLRDALGDDARDPVVMRRKVGEAFTNIETRLETDDGTKQALTPAPVRKVMAKTKAVIVHPSKDILKTFYEVTLGDLELRTTPAQMGGMNPGFLNSAWAAMFYEPLDATKGDWIKIRTFWMDPDLMKIDETEESTEAEDVIDRLRLELESVSLVESPDLVNDDNSAWRDPSNSEVWVPARRITRFLDETAKKPGWSSTLSKEIRAAGWMKSATRTKKMGNPPRETRCWVFVGGFAAFRDTRKPPANVSEYIGNTGGETGDR